MPSLNDGQLAGLASAAAKKATEASGVGHSVGERPLTAGMTVLVVLLSAASLCAASAVDYPASKMIAWLLAAGSIIVLVGCLYSVGRLENKGAIRLTRWFRILLIGWIALGAPVAVGLYTHFRYVPSAVWSGPTRLLAVIAIPLGVAGIVTLSSGKSRWIGLFLGLGYVLVALLLSFFVGLIVAGFNGDAL